MALMTGQYQYRLPGGLEEPIKEQPGSTLGLPPSHPSLASMLRKAGYATALVGKWHLGVLPHFGPLKSGYDQFFGISGGGADYFTHRNRAGWADLFEGEDPVRRNGYLTDLLTSRAVRYLEDAAAAPSSPFLLSLHYTSPHWPWETEKDEARAAEIKDLFDFGGGSLNTYAAMVASLDRGVGSVLEALRRTRLDDNTVVIFTSDNGGERYSRNWPLVGQKGDLLEGGIRVPAIIRYPGVLPPAQVSEQVTITMDWTATMLTLAGAKPELELEGTNILPGLARGASAENRKLFWRFVGKDQAAMRDGSDKYLRVGKNEYLFNIDSDPRERANLATARPERIGQMRDAFAAWNATMLPDEGVSGYVLGPDKVAGNAE
jgi:arylsulfatase A-like enzyme